MSHLFKHFFSFSGLDFDFITSPTDMYVIAGLPATMSCVPPISVPPAYVTWYKDDALLVPRTGEQSLRIIMSSSGSWDVEFAEVQKQDEGEYFCVANNDYAVPSTRTSRVATMQVGGIYLIFNLTNIRHDS